MYLGLGKKANIHVGPETQQFHVVRANVPFTLTNEGDTYQLKLESAGLQQVKFYSPAEIKFNPSEDVKLAYDAPTHTYTLTRYGDVTTLSFTGPVANAQ
ncbi:hypothetical protein D3C86_1923360 [compost metagenome]